MAKIRIEDIIEHLNYKMRNALVDAVKSVTQENVNEHDLYRAFRREVSYKCSSWEDVPDSYVEKD